MAASKPKSEPGEEEKLSAFLVVDGSRVFPIDQPTINIGRKKDNHIVIDNEHVSRYHAQIRTIKGRYVILDLNSTVGTSVNGKRIEQAFLRPGDVISLGGVPIIFGQGAQKSALEAPATASRKPSTGPTNATDIQSADKYLDLFNTPDE